jgi:ketosteroid isomerase-like protein
MRRRVERGASRVGLLLAVLGLFACGGGGDSPRANPAPRDFVGTLYFQVGAGDLDGDGRTDLAVIATSQDGDRATVDPVDLHILIQDPGNPGRFALRQRLRLADRFGAVALADLNSDLRLDIAVTEPESNQVRVFLQDPVTAGLFHLQETRRISDGVSSIEVADVDLDGAPDLVLASPTGVQVLRQATGAPGSFPLLIAIDVSQDRGEALDAEYDSLATGDLNDDGLVDIVTVRKAGNALVYFHEARVPGSFQPVEPLSLSLDVPAAITVGDLNGDGLLDVVAVGTTGTAFAQDVILRVRLQNAASPGSFLPVFRVTLGERGAPVHAIRALAADYSKLALAGNLDAWVDLYHSDAVRMNPGAPPLEGREAIRQWVGEVNHTVRAHEMEPIEVEGTRELAYVRGTSRSTLGAVLDGQDVTMADEVSWLAVVRPDASGAWRFYRLIYNTDLAPAAADGG